MNKLDWQDIIYIIDLLLDDLKQYDKESDEYIHINEIIELFRNLL